MIGYLDDFTLGGPIHALAADVDRLWSDAAKIGLELNVSKCEIICNENEKSLFCGTILENFKYVNKEMASLLGAPLLPGPAIDAALSKSVKIYNYLLIVSNYFNLTMLWSFYEIHYRFQNYYTSFERLLVLAILYCKRLTICYGPVYPTFWMYL